MEQKTVHSQPTSCNGFGCEDLQSAANGQMIWSVLRKPRNVYIEHMLNADCLHLVRRVSARHLGCLRRRQLRSPRLWCALRGREEGARRKRCNVTSQ